jgi:hypothetical protein
MFSLLYRLQSVFPILAELVRPTIGRRPSPRGARGGGEYLVSAIADELCAGHSALNDKDLATVFGHVALEIVQQQALLSSLRYMPNHWAVASVQYSKHFAICNWAF